MPELPEVETVRRGLLRHLRGQEIRAVKVLRPASIGYPTPRLFQKELVGRKFVDVQRRGKYLVFEFDNGAHMAAHLRMSGRLLVSSNGQALARENHIRVRFQLLSSDELIFEDMRVFGRLWFVPAGEAVEAHVSGLASLGVEPLDGLESEYLKAQFANRKQAIKTALLDQTVIAGIGNIYADESLHLSSINPLRSANDLSGVELARLAQVVVEVLEKAIALGGSSLRNYTNSDGVNGNYQQRAFVYGREGEPCHTCGREIVRLKIAGRSSHYCPQCQPLKVTQSTARVRSTKGKP